MLPGGPWDDINEPGRLTTQPSRGWFIAPFGSTTSARTDWSTVAPGACCGATGSAWDCVISQRSHGRKYRRGQIRRQRLPVYATQDSTRM